MTRFGANAVKVAHLRPVSNAQLSTLVSNLEHYCCGGFAFDSCLWKSMPAVLLGLQLACYDTETNAVLTGRIAP